MDDDTPKHTRTTLRAAIVEAGECLRRARAAVATSGEEEPALLLERLLALKEEYASLTGEEFRKPAKGSKRERVQRQSSEAAASTTCGDAERPAAERFERPSKRKKPATSGWGKEAEAPSDPMALPPPPLSFPAWTPRSYFRFEVLHRSRKPGSRARVGRIHTPHGTVDTPGFVPVGTNAALKAVDERQSREAGTQLMFCNTYHLLVHPGPEVVRKAGGLHAFMNHQGAIITDSGGFQVFSLAEPTDEDGPEMKSRAKRVSSDGSKNSASLLRINEHGAVFRSYHDGATIELTPESSVLAQKALASDIIIPLDELPPYHVSRERLQQSVRLSHRWMARSLRTHLERPQQQAMYAVVHGGTEQELRRESAEYLRSLPFDGFAIGGSLGKDRAEMLELLEFLLPLLPDEKPNHLLGIADPESAQAVVPLGVDTMDSCNPTRVARHGLLLCTDGAIKIKQSRFREDFGPIDPCCETIAHTRAYLHHLFKQHEPLYMTLASQHNMIYMNKLMAQMRESIMRDEI
uniref:tRNA-guanine(15) transglycosylase-like domain-containing protein n=1 Tax=Calcidiscus leptoporus TaxID=127549 RepID=A0A7S0J2P7_9EUKA|mmetsp:Transcript_36164/g.84504  ORF Transcript_36164/g.84504 Transcript_36164/m.84504 type:complete len:520 (+) Transcript_36164:202-1761(+)